MIYNLNFIKIFLILWGVCFNTEKIFAQRSFINDSLSNYCKKTILFSKKNNNNYTEINNLFNKNKIFLLGINFEQKNYAKITIDFFKNLYYNNNVRVIILPYAASLEYYFSKLNSPKIYNIFSSFYSDNLIEELKKFYLSLPEKDKFIVITNGVDIYDTPSIKILQNIYLTLDAPPDNIKKTFHILNNLAETSILKIKNDSIRFFCEFVINDITKNENQYRSYLKNDFDGFFKIIEYLNYNINKKIFAQFDPNLQEAENLMYKYSIKTLKKYPNSKYFVVSYIMSIIKQNVNEWYTIYDWNSTAARLNTDEDSPVKGKVFSCMSLYKSDLKDKKKSICFDNTYPLELKDFILKIPKKETRIFNMCDSLAPYSIKKFCNLYDLLIVF